MKKRIVLLAVVAAYFGHGLYRDAIEVHQLMQKYPNEFKQQGGFSFYKFYNTYRTLSYGDIMVKRGYVHHDICFEETFFVEDKSPSCLKQAKLTNFELNCNEAYATYACQVGDDVMEFTYTGNRNQKCIFTNYKTYRDLGPHPTLNKTYAFQAWYPDSIFDSPECTP